MSRKSLLVTKTMLAPKDTCFKDHISLTSSRRKGSDKIESGHVMIEKMFTSNVEKGYESCTPGIATIQIFHIVLGFVIKIILPTGNLLARDLAFRCYSEITSTKSSTTHELCIIRWSHETNLKGSKVKISEDDCI